MDHLIIYFWLTVALLIFLTIVTVLGHGIWLVLAIIFRAIFSIPKVKPSTTTNSECVFCGAINKPEFRFCGVCGRPSASPETAERLRDLAGARRQLTRWVTVRAVDEESAARMNRLIDQDRERIFPLIIKSEPVRPTNIFLDESPVGVPGLQVGPGLDYSALPESAWRDHEDPSHYREPIKPDSPPRERPADYEPQPPPPVTAPAPPSRPWPEVIAAFMEQSNIRWGEIIGGLLIVGCSTALVVSLWSEIAAIPVLKFLIFTSVTAALFGVGFYTEHKWKLPTTSRGILTIATLLVPLNFLAIAAVSSGVPAIGWPVLVSELIAPAVFACLVYFAGRILTPRWPHLLTGGVLLTSIGQLLVRHWAEPGLGQSTSLLLTALPVLGCLAATVFMLRRTGTEVDQADASAIFFTLGSTVFATVLPLGLLLFKTGTPILTLTNIAPALALIGLAPLAVGIFLWRALSIELEAPARTAATAVGIIGGVFALVAMLIGWPNPASVLPAALINCLCWSYLAWTFRWPRFYLVASGCFSLAAIIVFAVVGGEVTWQQSPNQRLFLPLFSGASGQALTLVSVSLLLAAEALRRWGRAADTSYLLVPACLTGSVAAALGLWFSFDLPRDPQFLSLTLTVLAGSALWVTYRTKIKAPAWIAVTLVWFAVRQMVGAVVFARFPWQTSALLVASLSAVASLCIYRFLRQESESEDREEIRDLFGEPLRWSSLALTVGVIAMLLQGRNWATTALIDARLFWLAAIWATLLGVIRSRVLFTATQAVLTPGIALAIKLALQNASWYEYLPSAFLHPWSLQIQGAAIVVTGLGWLALRAVVRGPGQQNNQTDGEAISAEEETDLTAEIDSTRVSIRSLLAYYLNTSFLALDQLLTAGVGVAFSLLTVYGAAFGVVREMSWPGAPRVMKEMAGFPHTAVFGVGAWLLLGLLLVAFLVNGWRERRRGFLVGAVGLVFTLAPLLAARWETVGATASAWNWSASILAVIVAAAIWRRDRLSAVVNRWGVASARFAGLSTPLRVVSVMLGTLPVTLFTFYALSGAIFDQPVGGPSAGIFYLLGSTISYAVPLVLTALVFTGHAARERSGGYAVWGGVATVFAVVSIHILSVQARGIGPDRVTTVQVFELVAIVASTVLLGWSALTRKWRAVPGNSAVALWDRWLSLLLWLAGTSLAVYLLPLAVNLFIGPYPPGTATLEAGGARSWLAWFLSVLAAAVWAKIANRKFSPWALFVSALSLAAMIGFASTRSTELRALHNFLLATIGVAALMLWARQVLPRREGQSTRPRVLSALLELLPPVAANWQAGASLAFGAAIMLATIMSLYVSNNSLWWPVLSLFTCALLSLAYHAVTGFRKAVYAAWSLAFLGANYWFISKIPHQESYSSFVFLYRVSVLAEWLSVNAIVLLAVGVLALGTELIRDQLAKPVSDEEAPPFYSFAAISGVFLLVVVVAIGLFTDATGMPLHLRWRFAILHVALLLGQLTIALWKRWASYAVPGLYLTLLSGLGLALDIANLNEHDLVWIGIVTLAGFALTTSAIWSVRTRWVGIIERLRIPLTERSGWHPAEWLLTFNAAAVAAVIALAVQVVTIFDEFPLRLICGVAIGVQVFTFAWLARGKWKPVALRAGLVVLSIGLVCVSWSFMDPDGAGTWLNRAVALLVVAVGCIALSGMANERISRASTDLAEASHWLTPKLAAAAVTGLLFVLGTEVDQQVQYGSVMTGPAAVIVVATALLGAVVLCIYFALSPQHDPLGLSERVRSTYVYTAEVLLVLLFVHIRLSVPEIFNGVFTAYWPMVVIAIAFAGVAISEFLRRRGLMVLAEPLHRTGAFLPLLPAIAFWIVSSKVDYSAVLFAVGMLYGTVSLLRRSLGFGLLAALACNGGLWFFLQHTGSFRIDQHPQIWFIPAALSVLVAGHLNRDRFTEEQMAGLRYACLSVIYVSSTVDIFLNGVAQSPWLPMVLAALAIAGVLCGVAFRIRAFVILGALFLLIAITTMIRYAQVSFGWTWLWYLAGIVAGGLILLTFALFEKKRRELATPIDEV